MCLSAVISKKILCALARASEISYVQLMRFPLLQVSLWKSSAHFCVAVIIDSRVLTSAAHCFRNVHYADIRAVIGERKLNGADGTGQVQRVHEVKLHESYASSTLGNDIALLLLNEPLTSNEYVRPV